MIFFRVSSKIDILVIISGHAFTIFAIAIYNIDLPDGGTLIMEI